MRLFSIGLVVLLCTACVGKGKYQLALDEAAANADARDKAKQRIAELERTLNACDADLKKTRSALDSQNRELAQRIADNGQLKRSVDELATAMAELDRRRQEAEANLRSYRDLVARFQAMIDAGTLRVKVIDGSMVVELATDILFPPGSATLSRDGRKAIAEVATVLASIPEREYQVAGHTDDQPIATAQIPSNWHLGSARAIAVTRVLSDSGLGAERVSAASFAEHRPADTNRTKEGRKNNRRIEIIVVPDLSTLPGYEELKKLGN